MGTYLTEVLTLIVNSIGTVFEVINTYTHSLATYIVPDPVVTDSGKEPESLLRAMLEKVNKQEEEHIKTLSTIENGLQILNSIPDSHLGIRIVFNEAQLLDYESNRILQIEKFCNQMEQTSFILESNLDSILTSVDTINSSINRQLSHLSTYRLCQNASIGANMVEEVEFEIEPDSFQCIPNIEELQCYTLESTYHAFIQLNEATEEILRVFAQADFNEEVQAERFRIRALEHERTKLLSLFDNLDNLNTDILDDFININNSSDRLQEDFNGSSKIDEFYEATHDKNPNLKFINSKKDLYNRVAYYNSLNNVNKINKSPYFKDF